jgi:nitrite reductase (NADH) small subunit
MDVTQAEIDVVAAPLSAVPPGEGRTFSLGGVRVAIFHTRDGGVFATQADCPHRMGPLSDGLVGGGVVVCPLHSWKFDLHTGHAIYGDCGIKTYPAWLDAGQRIVVKVSM